LRTGYPATGSERQLDELRRGTVADRDSAAELGLAPDDRERDRAARGGEGERADGPDLAVRDANRIPGGDAAV
jgi:hypothetical protein